MGDGYNYADGTPASGMPPCAINLEHRKRMLRTKLEWRDGEYWQTGGNYTDRLADPDVVTERYNAWAGMRSNLIRAEIIVRRLQAEVPEVLASHLGEAVRTASRELKSMVDAVDPFHD